MNEVLYACRFVHFTAAMLIFGTAAFRIYALPGNDTGGFEHPRQVRCILRTCDAGGRGGRLGLGCGTRSLSGVCDDRFSRRSGRRCDSERGAA